MAGADNVAGWDLLADAYQEHVGWVSDELTWGLRCPPESSLRLLDGVIPGAATTVVLGCGGGEDIVALSRLGAGPMIGVDPSARQLSHAARRCAEHGIDVTLHQAGAEQLDGLADDSADLVVSVQALNYVADASACMREVVRILRPGGILVFSTLHPADICTDDRPPHGWHTSWFQVEQDWIWDGLAEQEIPFRSWFRSASDWFTACADAGLVVERLLEPPPVDDERWIERGWLDPASYKKAEVVPSTILVRARRPAGNGT